MPSRTARPSTVSPDPARPARSTGRSLDPIAEPLHRSALHLLRLLRREDAATGVSAARLSALSVLVFGGPCTLGTLATAEQVSAPTITRLAQELEREGWARKRTDPDDARTVRLEATPTARRMMLAGRDRRLAALTRALSTLDAKDRRALERALGPMQSLVRTLLASAPAHQQRSGRRRHD